MTIMTDSSDESNDDEIARIADEYFHAHKSGSSDSVSVWMAKHPHLGDELRQSLEAIDLLRGNQTAGFPDRFDDFEILHELGRGGMGVVYAATQISLNRRVALKVVRWSQADPLSIDRFRREAQTVAAMRHEHIVPIYAIGQFESLQYFAMQLIDGESVAQMISKQKDVVLSRSAKREQLQMIAKSGMHIAEALEHAHQRGIVHSDIKPSNLLIDHSGRIWLTDFGLACHQDDQPVSASQPFQGTPKYMSPEQACAIDSSIDHRTDIYSLGATLIEWITGSPLVDCQGPVNALTQLQNDSTDELAKSLRGLGPNWTALLAKCTAREPSDRYQSAMELASDLKAIANGQSVSVRPPTLMMQSLSKVSEHRRTLRTAILSAATTIAILLIGSSVWQAFQRSALLPIVFETQTGELVTVTAEDIHGNRLAEFTAPSSDVLLPKGEVSLDVVAPYRLSYKRQMDTSSFDPAYLESPTCRLEEPQSHRWKMDDVSWFSCCDIVRSGKSTSCCIVASKNGLNLIDTNSGRAIWNYSDPNGIEWGNCVRGCPSTFQPDRCVVIHDTNGDGSQEIVLAHPDKAKLLCLNSADGIELWQSDLLDSAGIKTPDAASLCPIVLQEFVDPDGYSSRLSVVVASHAPNLAFSNRRWMSIDPVTGAVQWQTESALNRANAIGPIPLHLQWGEVEKRPHHFGELLGNHYFDDYSNLLVSPLAGSRNPYESGVRLGTERPISIRTDGTAVWHWIDGMDCQAVDPETGKLVVRWKLSNACVCAPKLLRTGKGKQYLLTVHDQAANQTDFVAWDLETKVVVWTKTIECDLDRLPQSYVSREQDFPVIADLDGDGVDEWIAPSFDADGKWFNPMRPPYGIVIAHRSDNGEAVWEKPFYVPSLDGMIERAVAVSDVDGDGWKELLFGTRFQGGGIREGVACFLDLVSGKTGHRIWHSHVRLESTKRTLYANELVNLAVLEDRGLIAVETRSGERAYELANSRPYSTTFLALATGKEQAFGQGMSSRSFSQNTWIEHRLPQEKSSTEKRERPGQLVGWGYPNATHMLWRADNQSPAFCGDLDRDGYPEVVGQRIDRDGFQWNTMLNGATGRTLWNKKFEYQHRIISCFDLERDLDGDGTNELVAWTSDDASLPGVVPTKLGSATIAILGGATGALMWEHKTEHIDFAHRILHKSRDSDRPPLLIYQNESKLVSCLDPDSRKVIWTSNGFQGHPYIWHASRFEEFFQHDGIEGWFSIDNSANDENFANFVDLATGELLSRVPLANRLKNGTVESQQIAEPAWIRWHDRDLLAIQSVSTSKNGNEANTYHVEVWLFEKSGKRVAGWTESRPQSPSRSFASWYKGYRCSSTPPTIVVDSNGEERLAIVTSVEDSIGLCLLAWPDTNETTLKLDEKVALPIGPNSNSVLVTILERHQDRQADVVAYSDNGLKRITMTGEEVWHKPQVPGVLTHFIYHLGDAYVGFDDGKTKSFFNVETGEKFDDLVGHPLNVQDRTSKVKCLSYIAWESDIEQRPPISRLTAYQVGTARATATAKQSSQPKAPDPRYVRLLPWVIGAKSFLWDLKQDFDNYSWLRLVKLTLFVFFMPALVAWNGSRRQLSIRYLLLIVTAVALALAVVISDKRAYPVSQNQELYLALSRSCGLAVSLVVLTLPFIELSRDRWRRVLSMSLYLVFLLCIPIFNLVCFPDIAIPTTYTLLGFWHVFWIALIPTGMILFVIHLLRFIFKNAVRIFGGYGNHFPTDSASPHVHMSGVK
jgi:serine/threonine protein kinase/outer membrane protein assembly factor BamB